MKIRSAFLLQVATSAIPSLILLLMVPIVKSRLSIDAFAGFTVIVSAIGLLSVLDGGLGRTATYFVSMARLKKGEFRTRAVLLGGLAISAGISIVVMMAGTILISYLNGEALVTARDAIYILLLFFPAFIAGSLLKGALEGQQRFVLSTALQLTYGAVIGIAPVFLMYHSSDLYLYAWVVSVARISLLFVLLFTTGLLSPGIWRLVRSVRVHAKRLFNYSKWLFFSNIVGLCIVFADRFAIINFFDSIVVAAYVLPMELISRSQLLVGAFCSVVFPRIVTHAQGATGYTFSALINEAQGFVVAASVVVGFVCVPIMEPLMGWWLGHALAVQAAEVTLVGVVGLALISSSAISMLAINGMGHTRQVAILHATELPLYLGLLYLAVRLESLQVLLAAWLFRMIFDALGMKLILHSFVKQTADHLPLRGDKTALHWVLLVSLTLVLLTLIFRAQFISSSIALYWAATGAVCSFVIFVNFGLRLRATILASSTQPHLK